jgi:hypothetical protein
MSILESLEKILNGMEDKAVEEDVIITKDDEVAEEDLKKLLMADKDQNVINEEIIEEGKKDPKAKIRNKPEPIFDDKSKKVTDSKDHFPINTKGRAKNALARAGVFVKKGKSPKWYKGSVSQFIKSVKSAVKKAYPDIEISKD